MVKLLNIESHITLEPLPSEEGMKMDERRLPVQLYKYWDMQRKERAFCGEDDINPDDIPTIWPYCFLIQVNDLKNRHRADFTYLGTEILRVYHEVLCEADSSDLISPNTSHLSQNFWMVIEKKAPIMQSGEFPSSRGSVIKFRQCLLPIGKHDDDVESIFGCARLKVYN